MDFKQYRGKNILAWLSYNANYEDPYGGVNRVCYAVSYTHLTLPTT